MSRDPGQRDGIVHRLPRQAGVGAASPPNLEDGMVVRVTSDAFRAVPHLGETAWLRSARSRSAEVRSRDGGRAPVEAADASGHLDATLRRPAGGHRGRRARSTAPLRPSAASWWPPTPPMPPNRWEADLVPVRGRRPQISLPEGHGPRATDSPSGPVPPLEGPVGAGTTLDVVAAGFQPGEPLLIAYCTNDLEAQGMVAVCEPLDAADAVSAVVMRTVDGDFPTANADGVFSTSVAARATVIPYGDDLGKALSDYGAATTTQVATTSATTQAGATTTNPPLGQGEVRCTEATGGCIIVIAAADTKRSATLPYVVAG